jgi:glycerophosphoryl diester phosphodiesterase
MSFSEWSLAKKIVVPVLCAAGAFAIYKGVQQGIWLHNYCKLAPYEVKSIKGTPLENDKDLHLTAHRGFRAVAPENSLPAYVEAGKAGFWGAECDVYMTKDGVWVIHHDPVTYRVMNGTKAVELSTLDELNELDFKVGHNIDKYPNLKICTLEEFYQQCAKYNMHAVVEIKYNRNRKYYDKLLALAEKYNVETTYIAFNYEDLVTLRAICDNELYYLVYDIHDKQIEQASKLENCGISYDGNDPRNIANDGEMIKKCHAAGVKTATWAVDDLELIEKLVGYGTKYVTTNSVTY